jgi:opacity protein-like surface antigen
MKKTLSLIALLAILLPGLASADAITFRLGYFIPQANSDLWQIEFENMTFKKTDYQNTVFGFTYEHFLTREVSLIVGLDAYSQTRSGTYLDYVGLSFEEGEFAFPNDYAADFYPGHSFSVSITPIQIGLKLTPLGRKSGFIPYLGGGVSLYIWNARLVGDLVDFSDDSWVYDDPDYGEIQIYPIYSVNARDETRFAVGFNGFAGFMIPFASRVALEGEFKYSYGKGSHGDAFPDFNKFDLGSYQISLGINYWF